MTKIYSFLPLFIFMVSCGVHKNEKVKHDQTVSELPDDLFKIQENDLEPILTMLGDAKLIGVSEGTHGMIEPFLWRNSLIKFLVEKKRISVIAIESGLVESRFIYDYVNGTDLNLDSVLSNGIQCGFSRFKQNRELLVWLREFNSTKSENEKIHIYGFDIPGCAPNPVLENAMSGFDYVLDYFKIVNLEKSQYYTEQLSPYMEIFRIKDNGKDSLNHFTDIDSVQWENLNSIQQNIKSDLTSNSKQYILKSSQLDYDWALLAINGAHQNIDFLYAITHHEIEYAPREKGQYNNVKWIMEREKDKSILLFAHLAHLTKEIHMKDGKMAHPMCGEYLAEEYGENYKVIGNFYSVLDYFGEGKLEFKINRQHIEKELLKANSNNYYFELNKDDKKWNKEWIFGKPSSAGDVYMIPSEGIDIIFFNKIQTWIDAERYK